MIDLNPNQEIDIEKILDGSDHQDSIPALKTVVKTVRDIQNLPIKVTVPNVYVVQAFILNELSNESSENDETQSDVVESNTAKKSAKKKSGAKA